MGEARSAKFGVGDAPLVGIFLPDAIVRFGYLPPEGGECADWLVASLALELGIGLSGRSESRPSGRRW